MRCADRPCNGRGICTDFDPNVWPPGFWCSCEVQWAGQRCEKENTGLNVGFNPGAVDPNRPYGGYHNVIFPQQMPAMNLPPRDSTPSRPAARLPIGFDVNANVDTNNDANAEDNVGTIRNKRNVDAAMKHRPPIIGPQRNVVGPIVVNDSMPTLVRHPRPKSFVLRGGKLLNTVDASVDSGVNDFDAGM